VTHAGYAALFAVSYLQIQGAPLGELIEAARDYRKLCVRLGLPEIDLWLSFNTSHARSWTGTAPGPGETEIDFAATDRALTAIGAHSLVVQFRILELERRFWRGDFAGVLDIARAIAPLLVTIPASVSCAEFKFYHCLAMIAAGDTGGEREPAPQAELAAHHADLVRYAAGCPANFGHMAALVAAELARSRGDVAQALARYDEAIEGAAEHGFVKVETIAHELAAQFGSQARSPRSPPST
jgi:hypothetical protein